MKLQERMLRSIQQRVGNIILRTEVARMGSPTQVTEVLRLLQNKGVIVRIGRGIYAKTRKSSITGAIIPSGQEQRLMRTTLAKRLSCQGPLLPILADVASAEK